MAKNSHPLGGGIGSKNIVEKPVRTGQKPTGVNPANIAQIGAALGNHVTDGGNARGYRGEAFRTKTPISVPLGNQLSNNVGKGGPGAGRVVHHCGSQTGMSPVRSPNATGRDTLAEFGPDTSNARNRR
jgi:hypothetical protein